MVFYRSLSESKSLHVSGTLLSILVGFNNALVNIVSARSPIPNSSMTLIKPLAIVLSAPIIIGIQYSYYKVFLVP